MGTAITCMDCGNRVEHDTEAESWLKTEVLYDPNAADIDQSGRTCAETSDNHRPAYAATFPTVAQFLACTHRTNTAEHLTVCCADGVDCDVCGQPIEGLTGPMLLAEGDFDAAVCTDCGFDRLYQLEA